MCQIWQPFDSSLQYSRYHKSFLKRIINSYYRLRNSKCILAFNLLPVKSLSIKLFLLLIY